MLKKTSPVNRCRSFHRLDSNTSEEDAEAELSSLVNNFSAVEENKIKDPEIHTYQEIVEIIETVQVPKVAKDIAAPSPLPQLLPAISIQEECMEILSDADHTDADSVISDRVRIASTQQLLRILKK